MPEQDARERAVWDESYKLPEESFEISPREAWVNGNLAGREAGFREITIQLVNCYNDSLWWARPLRLKAFIDQLWEQYGPKYEENL